MFRLQYRYSRIDKPEPKKLQNKKTFVQETLPILAAKMFLKSLSCYPPLEYTLFTFTVSHELIDL